MPSMMTDSKIIHQADQIQQFQQNPQYYNRNINHDEICHNIGSISKEVNSFVSNLIATENKYGYLKNSCDISKKSKNKDYRINKPKSQIDSIIINMQSLIEDLDWVKKDVPSNSQLRDNREILSSNLQIGSFSLLQPRNKSTGLKKYSLNMNRSKIQKNTKSLLQDQKRFINRTVQIAPSTLKSQNNKKYYESQQQSLNSIPKTVNIYQKKYLNQKQKINFNESKNINRVFFDRLENNLNDDFNQFDDKDTVVNEPIYKASKRHIPQFKKHNQGYHTKQQFEHQKKQKIPAQNHRKLTKRKLYQKMQQLQKQIEGLKMQKIIKQSSAKIGQNNTQFISKRVSKTNQTLQNQCAKQYQYKKTSTTNRNLTNLSGDNIEKNNNKNKIRLLRDKQQSFNNNKVLDQKPLFHQQTIERKVIKSSLEKNNQFPNQRSKSINFHNFQHNNLFQQKQVQQSKKVKFKDNFKISLEKWVMENV